MFDPRDLIHPFNPFRKVHLK